MLAAVIGPFALFAMGLFFLMAGLLTPESLSRKGPVRFARDRLWRLGVPLVVVTLVLWPPLIYGMNLIAGQPIGSSWSQFVHVTSFPDPGPLWFVEVLLIYSLGYAAWRGLRGARAPGPVPVPTAASVIARPLRGRQMLAIAVGIAVASYVVRLWFPLDTPQVAGLHLWQWPQCLAMFGLGVVAARRGWLTPVSGPTLRGCGKVALLGALAVAVLAVAAATSVPREAFFGGWHWASLATAMVEGTLAVGASVWLLGLAQRHLDRWSRFRHAAARSTYAAFVVQGHVLIGLALVARPLGVPAEVKALGVSVTGVVVSFGLGSVLARHPAFRRLL